MDEIVKQALAKWPNVPHCYGWLALDARGAWRMRDERARAQNLPGDKIVHPALLGFINRNYMHDDQGRWYFQNGPQRVYVDLEVAPYVAYTDPVHGFVLQTGEPMTAIDAAWLTEEGRLLLESAGKIALVDDRDIAHCITHLRSGDVPLSDEQLLAWLEQPDGTQTLTLDVLGKPIPVKRIVHESIGARFKFIQKPRSNGK
jgi:hypothetical protein